MADFSLHFKEPANYRERENSSLRLVVAVSLGVAAFWALVNEQTNWMFVLLMAALFFLVQYLKAANWNTYFITEIEFEEGNVRISYTEKGEPREVVGHSPDFAAKIKLAFSKTRTPYLAIYFKGKLLLTQYKIGGWSEEQFKMVTARLS